MAARRKMRGRIVRKFGMGLYTSFFKMNNHALYNTGNSAECFVAAGMGGTFQGEWIYVHVWLSPFAVHLQLPQHC